MPLQDKAIPFHSYHQLQTEWSKSRQGAGGVNAIKGFNFQLLSVIKKLVLTDFSNTSVTTEEISDITELHPHVIVITQTKYCITSGAVLSALNELWAIYKLIIRKYSELSNCIEFHILGEKKDLGNVQNTIETWKAQTTNNTNRTDISDFINKVSAEVEENPFGYIQQALIEEYSVDSPLRVINKWLGSLYNAVTKEAVKTTCFLIQDELRAFREEKNRKDQELSFYFWKRGDAPPNKVQKQEDLRKACIAGETPKKVHLTEGCFASRSVYSDIFQKFCSWVESAKDRASLKLPVFWISGRSGSGKSVALLHLLSMIKSEDREAVVAWFGDKPKALRTFSPYLDELSGTNENIYLCFDDPYVYQRQDVFNEQISCLHDRMERLCEKHSDLNRPFLICCGPDEQLEWCEEELGDYLEITKYRLKDENYNDLEEIKEWFEKRTGVKVAHSNEGLLVQTLFEWSSKTSLKDFAVHFKKRLSDSRWDYKEISPFEFVSSVLAVNRLYALFPNKKVEELRTTDAKLAKAIYQLEKEDHHLTLTSEDEGVKLTHPHLADILYREWYGKKSDSQSRKNHLTEWIVFVENEYIGAKDSLSPFWQLAKLSNPNFRMKGVLVPRIDLIFDDLKYILPEFYKRHLELGHPLSYLPVWTVLDNNFQLRLDPSPLDIIGDDLVSDNIEEVGFRLSCHKVIEFYGVSNNLTRENLLSIIKNHKNWYGWGYVLFDYVRKLGVNELEGILIELIENDASNPVLIKISHFLCQSPQYDPKIQRVMSYWLETCDVFFPSWVANFTDFSRHFVINTSLKIKATSFLKQCGDHKSWSHVWEALWCCESRSDELEFLARDWLKLQKGKDGGWSFVWEKLAEGIPQDRELIEIGYEYFDGEYSSKSKKCVWTVLKKQNADNLRLERIAKTWLLTTPVQHREWIYLWAEVVKSFEIDKEIVMLGREWLYQASVYHATWGYALSEVSKKSKVLGFCIVNKKLYENIIFWLEFNSMEDESWQYFWEEAYGYNPKNKLLIQLGLNWLRTTPFHHKAWAKIWEKCWDKELDKNKIQQFGLNWLSKASFKEYRWQYVWVRLFKNSPNSDDLRKMAYNWLDRAPAKHHSWVSVWEHMWNVEENTERLRSLAYNWLKSIPKEYKGVKYIQIELEKPVSMNDKLEALQNKWNGNKK